MQYLVIAYDNENALDKRLEVRDEHIKAAKELIAKGNIITASALIEEDKMVGSSLFVDFDTDDDFDTWLENEPYVKAGVWNMNELQVVPVKVLPKD